MSLFTGGNKGLAIGPPGFPPARRAVARLAADDVSVTSGPIRQSLLLPADGKVVRVIVDQSEDLGRVGFSGLLADVEPQPAIVVESPESWAPVGVSSGAIDDAQRHAVEDFCLWLADQRLEARS